MKPAKLKTAPQRLPLSSLRNARRSLARILEAFYRNQIDDAKARTMIYGISSMVAFFKAEQDADILKRLEALESSITKKDRT